MLPVQVRTSALARHDILEADGGAKKVYLFSKVNKIHDGPC
jgi:hypothetical protein